MIPIIDLFSGPGGLAEGFGALRDGAEAPLFDIRASFEKESVAHRTLSLRAFYRAFGHPSDVPGAYYDYLRGKISREDLLGNSRFLAQVNKSKEEAHCHELGVTPAEEIDQKIARALKGDKPWVLIGGPPCQVYSVVGRSRWRRDNVVKFENDHRHFLYKEYLRIIQKFRPAIFVMENVRGVLSSTHGGSPIFQRILDDLSKPCNGLRYQIRSFNFSGRGLISNPMDYVVKAEDHGLPQARHRVMLLGVREDLSQLEHVPLQLKAKTTVKDAIGDMPPIRSMLSRGNDSLESWSRIFHELLPLLEWSGSEKIDLVSRALQVSKAGVEIPKTAGGRFIDSNEPYSAEVSDELTEWLYDERLRGHCQHEARSHMRRDLHRYLYAACYAMEFNASPMVDEFPNSLIPEHANVFDVNVPFRDRFRVQLAGSPSTTVVSHISKDGHYYIHYDPAQCRSLTVREAARLQTFPDNYFFEGNRTEQYWQVGNAVPPLLARQIAKVVASILNDNTSANIQQQPTNKIGKSGLFSESLVWQT